MQAKESLSSNLRHDKKRYKGLLQRTSFAIIALGITAALLYCQTLYLSWEQNFSAVLLIALLPFLPLGMEPMATKFDMDDGKKKEILTLCVILAGVVMVRLYFISGYLSIMGALAFMQGIQIRHGKKFTFSYWCLWIAYFQTWLAATLFPSGLSLLLVFIQCVAIILALVLAHSHTLSIELHKSVRRMRIQTESRRNTHQRIGFGLILGVLVVVFSLALFHGGPRLASEVDSWFSKLQKDEATSGDSEEASREGQQDSNFSNGGMSGLGGIPEITGSGGNENAAELPAMERIFPGSISLGGSSRPIRDGRILGVHLNATRDELKLEPGRPLLLKSLTLDTIDLSGATSSTENHRKQRREDISRFDQKDDGWIIFPENRLWIRKRLQIRVIQTPLLRNQHMEQPLFYPEPLYALKEEIAYTRANGSLVLPSISKQPLNYLLEVGYPVFDTYRRMALDHPSRISQRFLTVPKDTAALRPFRQEARKIFAGSKSDTEKIVRLLNYYKSHYRYSLEVSKQPAMSDLLGFLKTKRGYCTYFASLGMLLLRLADVPCRMAIGYSVYEWSEREEVYVAHAHNAHAWLEVPLEGLGWIPIDTTPAGMLNEALDNAGFLDLVDGEPEWALPVEPTILREDDEEEAATVNSELLRWTTLGAGGWFYGAGLLFLLLFIARTLIRQSTPPSVRPDGASAPTELTVETPEFYVRVLNSLERLGYKPQPGQTPQEFSQDVVQQIRTMAPLNRVTRLYYRIRYGGGRLRVAEEVYIEDFLANIPRHVQDGKDASA